MSAVGSESESDLVDRILLGLKRPPISLAVPGLTGLDPGARLLKATAKYLDERPKESLLVFLDEADQFVARQLELYDRDKEKTLSFKMRTDIEREPDSAGLPRIRFVFAGYRMTHTRLGAWANWGEVLNLRPLKLGEAADLVAGPLSRLGIDAVREALNIAWRCGCQPAVLLKFGERLLKHLDSSHPIGERKKVQVDAGDVAIVFSDEQVREEIRTVVRNNFQGDRRARVVFYALAEAFQAFHVGHGFTDPEGEVLRVLEDLDPDLSWLHPQADSRRAEVSALLADFVDRELVVPRTDPSETTALFLRHPHHLNIILTPDINSQLREDIRNIRLAGEDGRREVRALVPVVVLDQLRSAVESPDPGLPIRAVVIGTQWPEAFLDTSGGIPDRLGFNRDETVEPKSVLQEAKRRKLAVGSATFKILDRLLEIRTKGLPPPVCIGGVDLLREALRRQRRTTEVYEICQVGRLGAPVVAWWWQRVRGCEFVSQGWVKKVLEVTDGVPVLLARFGQALEDQQRKAGGTRDISVPMLNGALEQVEAGLREVAAALKAGPPALQLSPREIQILQMVAHVARETEFKSSSPAEDLTDGWDTLFRAKLDAKALDRSSDEDMIALQVLEYLGLLGIDHARNTLDPLLRISVGRAGDVTQRVAALLAGT